MLSSLLISPNIRATLFRTKVLPRQKGHTAHKTDSTQSKQKLKFKLKPAQPEREFQDFTDALCLHLISLALIALSYRSIAIWDNFGDGGIAVATGADDWLTDLLK